MHKPLKGRLDVLINNAAIQILSGADNLTRQVWNTTLDINLKQGFDGKPDLYSKLEQCHPQQRIGQPTEVARLALVLASEGMDFLHGSCLGLDGGISVRIFDPN